MKLLVVNGPNLNMLGIREKHIYGNRDYEALCAYIREIAQNQNADVEIFQSNHEGDIVDRIQKAYFDGTQGIVINAGAYTHTSVAILDAMKAVDLPGIEVHLSDINAREEFRRLSYVGMACEAHFIGMGFEGYKAAIEYLCKRK